MMLNNFSDTSTTVCNNNHVQENNSNKESNSATSTAVSATVVQQRPAVQTIEPIQSSKQSSNATASHLGPPPSWGSYPPHHQLDGLLNGCYPTSNHQPMYTTVDQYKSNASKYHPTHSTHHVQHDYHYAAKYAGSTTIHHPIPVKCNEVCCQHVSEPPRYSHLNPPSFQFPSHHVQPPRYGEFHHGATNGMAKQYFYGKKNKAISSSASSSNTSFTPVHSDFHSLPKYNHHYHHHHQATTGRLVREIKQPAKPVPLETHYPVYPVVNSYWNSRGWIHPPPTYHQAVQLAQYKRKHDTAGPIQCPPAFQTVEHGVPITPNMNQERSGVIMNGPNNSNNLNNNMVCSLPKLVNDYHKKSTVRTDCFDLNSQYINSSYPPSIVRNSGNKIMINNIAAPVPQSAAPHSQNLSCQLMNVDKQQIMQSDMQYNIGESSVISTQHQHDASPTQCVNVLSSSPHSNNCMVNETINCDPINYSISNNDMYNQANSNPAAVVNLKPFQNHHNVASMEHVSGVNSECSQIPSREQHQQHENVMKKPPDLDVRQFLVSWNDADEDNTRFSEPQNNSTSVSVNKNSSIDEERRAMTNTPTSKGNSWNSSSPVPSQPRSSVSKNSSGLVTESNHAVRRISENENYDIGRGIINKDMNNTNSDRNVNNCMPMTSRPVPHQNNDEIHTTYVNPYPNNSNRIVNKIGDKGLLIDGHSQHIDESHFQMCNGYNNWNNSSKYRNDSAVIENSGLYSSYTEPNHHAYSSIRQHYTSANPSNPNNTDSHLPIQSNIGIGHAIVHNIQREHTFEKKSNVNIVEPIIPERNSLMFHRNNDVIDRKINHLTSENSSKGYYNSLHTDTMVQHRSVIDNGCNFINLAEYNKNENSDLCIPMNTKTVQPSLMQEKSFLGYKSNGVICENNTTTKFPLTDTPPKVDHNMVNVVPQQITTKNPTSPIVIHFDSNDELRNNSLVSSEHIFQNSFLGEKQKSDVSIPNTNSNNYVDLSSNNNNNNNNNNTSTSTDCVNLKNNQRNTSPNTLNCLSRINNESAVNSGIVQPILKSPSNSSSHSGGDNNLDGSRNHVGDINTDSLFFGTRVQSSNELLSPKKPLDCSPKDPLENKSDTNNDNTITLHSVDNEEFTSISVSRISGSDCSTYVEQYTNIEQSFTENILKSSDSCNSSNINFVQSENVCENEVDKGKYINADKSSSLVTSCPNKEEVNSESSDENKLSVDNVNLKPDNGHVIKMKLSKKIMRKKLTPNLKLKRLPNSKGWVKISENYCSKSRKNKHKSIVNSCILSEKETSSPASSQSSVLEIVESSSCDFEATTDVISSGEVAKVKDQKRLSRVLSMPSLDDSPNLLNDDCNNPVKLLNEKDDSVFGDTYNNNTENLTFSKNYFNESTTEDNSKLLHDREIKNQENIGEKISSVYKYAENIIKNHFNDNEKNDNLLNTDDNLNHDFESTCCINKVNVLTHKLNDFHNSFELNCKNNLGKISDINSSLLTNEQKITDCSVKYFNNCSKSPEKQNFIEPFSKSCNNKAFTSPSAVCFKLSKSDSLQTSHSTSIHDDDNNDDTCDYDEERLISSVECTPGSPNVEELFEDINKTTMDNLNKSDFDTTNDKNEHSLEDDNEDINRFQSNRHCNLVNDICLNSKATQETVIKSTSISCPSTSGNENDFDYNVSSETANSLSQPCFNKNIYSSKENNESVCENIVNNQSLINTETVTSIINLDERSKQIVNKLKSNIDNDAINEVEVNSDNNDFVSSSQHENSSEVNLRITDVQSKSLIMDKVSSKVETESAASRNSSIQSTDDNVDICEDNDQVNENIFDIESLCDDNNLPSESNDDISKIVTFQSLNNPSEYNSDSVIDLSIGSKDKLTNGKELIEKSKNDIEGEMDNDAVSSQKNTESNNKSLGIVTELLSETDCDNGIEKSIHLPDISSEDNCMLPNISSTDSCCDDNMTLECEELPQAKSSGELLENNNDAQNTVDYSENVGKKKMENSNHVEIDNKSNNTTISVINMNFASTKTIDYNNKNDDFERNNSVSLKVICEPITTVIISKHDDSSENEENDDIRHEINECENENSSSCASEGQPKQPENDNLLKITCNNCEINEPNSNQNCESSENSAFQENYLNTAEVIAESNVCKNDFGNVNEIEECQEEELVTNSFKDHEKDDGDHSMKATIAHKLQTLNVTDKLSVDEGFNPEVNSIKNNAFSIIKTDDRITNNEVYENFPVGSDDSEVIHEDNVKLCNSSEGNSENCTMIQQNESHPYCDEDLKENKVEESNKKCNSIFCSNLICNDSKDLSSNDDRSEEIQLCNEEVAEDNRQEHFEQLPIVDTVNSLKKNCTEDENFENMNDITGKDNAPSVKEDETDMNTSIDLSVKPQKIGVTEKIDLDGHNSFVTNAFCDNKNVSFHSSTIKVLNCEIEDKFIENNENKINDKTVASRSLDDCTIDLDPNSKTCDKNYHEKSSPVQYPSSICKENIVHNSSDDTVLRSSSSEKNCSNKEFVKSFLNNSIVELVSESSFLNNSVNDESEIHISCHSTLKSLDSIDHSAKKKDENEVQSNQSSDSNGNSNTDNNYEKIIQKPMLCERNLHNSNDDNTEIVVCDKSAGLFSKEDNYNQLLSDEIVAKNISTLNECNVSKLTGDVKSIELENQNKIASSIVISKNVIEEKQPCCNSLNNKEYGAYISNVDDSELKLVKVNDNELSTKEDISKNVTFCIENNSVQLESYIENSATNTDIDNYESGVNCFRADEVNEKESIINSESHIDSATDKICKYSENLDNDLNLLTKNKNQSSYHGCFEVENCDVIGPASSNSRSIEDTTSVTHKTVDILQNSSAIESERIVENSSGCDGNKSDCDRLKQNITLTCIHDDTDLACNETVKNSIASSSSKPSEILNNSEVLTNICYLTSDNKSDENINSVVFHDKEKILHRNKLKFTEQKTENCLDENYSSEGSKIEYFPKNHSADCSVTFENYSSKSSSDCNNQHLFISSKEALEGYCSSAIEKCLIKKKKFSKHRKSVSNSNINTENYNFHKVSNVCYIKRQLFLKTQSRLKNSLSRTLLKRYKSFLKRKKNSINIKSSTSVGGSIPYENLKFIKNNKKRKQFEENQGTINNFDEKNINKITSSPIHCDLVIGCNILNSNKLSVSQPEENLKEKLMVVVNNLDELSPIESVVCHPSEIKESLSSNVKDSDESLSQIIEENDSEKHVGSFSDDLGNSEICSTENYSKMQTIEVESLQNSTHESSLDANETISKKRKMKHRKSITSLPLSIRRKLKLNKLKKRYNECLKESSVSCNGNQLKSDVVSFKEVEACVANKISKDSFCGFDDNESSINNRNCCKKDTIVNEPKISRTDELISADVEFSGYSSCNVIAGGLHDCIKRIVPQTESIKNNHNSSLINKEDFTVNADVSSVDKCHVKGVDHNLIQEDSLELLTDQEVSCTSAIVSKTDEEFKNKNNNNNNKLPAINVGNSNSIVIIIEELCNSQDKICSNSSKEKTISSDYKNEPQNHEFSHPAVLESPKKFSHSSSPSHNDHKNENSLKQFIENDDTCNEEEICNKNLDNYHLSCTVNELDNSVCDEKQFITDVVDDFSVAEVEVGYNGEVESDDVCWDNGNLNRDLYKYDTSQIEIDKHHSEHNSETDYSNSDNEGSPYGCEGYVSEEENINVDDQADYYQDSCNNNEFVNEYHHENEGGTNFENSSEMFIPVEDVSASPRVSVNNKIITSIVNDESKHYDIISISPTVNDDYDTLKNCDDSAKPIIKCSLPWERVFNTSRSRKRKIKRNYSSNCTNGIEFGPAKIEFRVGTGSIHEDDERNTSCWKVIDNYSSAPIKNSNRNSCISPVVKVKRLILQRDPELTSYSEGSGSSSKEFSSSSSDEDNKDDKDKEKFQLSPSSSLTSFSVVSYSDDKFIGNDSSSSSIPKVLIRKMKRCQYKSFLKIPNRFNEPVVKITRSNVIDNLALEKKTSVNLSRNSCNFNGDIVLKNDKKVLSQATPSSPSHVFKLSDDNLIDKPDCNSFSNPVLDDENFNSKLTNNSNNENINNNNLFSDSKGDEALYDNDVSSESRILLTVSSESRSQNGLLQSSQLAFQNCDNNNDRRENEDCINNCEKLTINKCKYTQDLISTDTVSSDINNETEKIDSQHSTSTTCSSVASSHISSSRTVLGSTCSVNEDNNLLVNNKFSDTVISNSSDSCSEIDKRLGINELKGRGIKRPCEKLPSGTSLVLKKRTFKNISKYMFHCKRCLLVFNNKEEVMNHQATKHPAHQELHHCILCQRSFSSLNKHQMHTQSRSHRRLELLQRCTIHAMHRYFTGRDCPRLCPLTAAELKSFDWRPNQPSCIHFYHHPSPLQLALQENPWGMKNKDSFEQSAVSSFSTSSSSSSPARSSASSPAHAPATPFLLSPSPEISDVLNNNNSRNGCHDS